jgi:hypothetical protein
MFLSDRILLVFEQGVLKSNNLMLKRKSDAKLHSNSGNVSATPEAYRSHQSNCKYGTRNYIFGGAVGGARRDATKACVEGMAVMRALIAGCVDWSEGDGRRDVCVDCVKGDDRQDACAPSVRGSRCGTLKEKKKFLTF